MKVYFTNTYLEGCGYVRSIIPMRALGADGDKTSLRSERISEEQRARAVIDADIVVFHRPNDDRSLQIARILKSQGKKIVMDNDDTYKGFDQTKLGKLFPKIDRAIDDFGSFADLITCSTGFLSEEYKKLNPNVVVLPNCVDPEDWPDESERNEGDKVRIGLVGSVGLHSDVEGFNHVLDALKDRPDVQLVVFALPRKAKETEHVQKIYENEYKFWESYGVEWHPFVPMAEYIDTLNELKLDILLIPRSDDYFNRCKSNLKFLEASMLEIPVVAQGFTTNDSPYQVDPEDAAHMRVVIDPNDWLPNINELIANKELRREQGKKAKEYVMNKYAIENNIHKWETAYQQLLK